MAELPTHTIKESIGHQTRGTTVVTIGALDDDGEESNLLLAETVEYLQSLLASIPEEHRTSARLRIKAYGDYASLSSKVIYERPETDAELADRSRWLSSIRQESEDRDRREFARLKRKFTDAG